MKLVHPWLESPIEFKENQINSLIVESPTVLSMMVKELLDQSSGYVGRFILSSEFKELEISKTMEIIINPFSMELNQRRLLTKLYLHLQDTAMSEDFYVDTMEMISSIQGFLERLTDRTEFSITHTSELDLINLFKFADVRLNSDSSSLLEMIVDYMKALRDFCGVQVFILLNLKSFLSNSELSSLYDMIFYQKYAVLLIESSVRDPISVNERRRIIDIDLCEI